MWASHTAKVVLRLEEVRIRKQEKHLLQTQYPLRWSRVDHLDLCTGEIQ